MSPLKPSELKQDKVIQLEKISFSEQEIIDFALANDPQLIHTDKEFAKQSAFKGLIACGAHAYVYTHKTFWIELAKETFICGLEINNWKFYKPIYAAQAIYPRITITEVKPNSDGRTGAITWKFEFLNGNEELIQSLDVKVMHKLL